MGVSTCAAISGRQATKSTVAVLPSLLATTSVAPLHPALSDVPKALIEMPSGSTDT